MKQEADKEGNDRIFLLPTKFCLMRILLLGKQLLRDGAGLCWLSSYVGWPVCRDKNARVTFLLLSSAVSNLGMPHFDHPKKCRYYENADPKSARRAIYFLY
jgi:hypothetical protein